MAENNGGAGGGGAGGGAGGGTGGGAGGTTLGNEPSWETTVPAKFREGGKADGAINHGEIFKAYSGLEGQMRNVGKPPEKPDGYKFKPDDKFPLDNKFFEDVRGKAHGAGLTDAQFEFVAGTLAETATSLATELRMDLLGTQESCEKALGEVWKDPALAAKNRQAANRAFKQLFGDDAATRAVIGNMPKVIMALAKIGAEMKEDAAPGGAESGAESAESLDAEIKREMADKAYTNRFHKDHAAQKAKVEALFLKRYGNAPATGAKVFG